MPGSASAFRVSALGELGLARHSWSRLGRGTCIVGAQLGSVGMPGLSWYACQLCGKAQPRGAAGSTAPVQQLLQCIVRAGPAAPAALVRIMLPARSSTVAATLCLQRALAALAALLNSGGDTVAATLCLHCACTVPRPQPRQRPTASHGQPPQPRQPPSALRNCCRQGPTQ